MGLIRLVVGYGKACRTGHQGLHKGPCKGVIMFFLRFLQRLDGAMVDMGGCQKISAVL